ncbi:MAG: hypothetical protein AAF558_12365 [Verrucomicrobiota bacterium]
MKVKEIAIGLVIGLITGLAIGWFVGGGASDAGLSMIHEEPSQAMASQPEKLLEARAQVTLLKKMLGEIESDLILMAPVGSQPIARGRLVWDSTRMEGFLYAIHLESSAEVWELEIVSDGKNVATCQVSAPTEGGKVQSVFRPSNRVLKWDEFRLIGVASSGEREVVLVGKRD